MFRSVNKTQKYLPFYHHVVPARGRFRHSIAWWLWSLVASACMTDFSEPLAMALAILLNSISRKCKEGRTTMAEK